MSEKNYITPPDHSEEVEPQKEYVKPPKKDYIPPPQKAFDSSMLEDYINDSELEITEESEENDELRTESPSFFQSLKMHLTPEYRRSYNIRRFLGCAMLFLTLKTFFGGMNNGFSLKALIPYLWAFLSWIFWHYAFWSFKGGIIDSIASSLIYFGSCTSILWRLFIQNTLILFWITLIAPFSDFKTWRKAVKSQKELYIHKHNDI